MSARWWIAIAATLLVLALAGVVIVQYLGGPLRQASPRTCVGCVEWHWNARSSIRASRYTGDLRFQEEVRYALRFDAGEARLAGSPLTPGCHEGTAAAGDLLELDGVEELRLEAPAEPGRCDAFETD